MLAVSAFCFGCQSSDPEAQTRAPSFPESTAPSDSGIGETGIIPESAIFKGTGIVRNITPSRTFVVIEHQEITGYMGAMTMPFPVNDENILGDVVTGDSVDFKIAVSDSETVLSEIKKTLK